jgi:hypothetical protein
MSDRLLTAAGFAGPVAYVACWVVPAVPVVASAAFRCLPWVVRTLLPYVVSAADGPGKECCRICSLGCCCSWQVFTVVVHAWQLQDTLIRSIHTSGVVLHAAVRGVCAAPQML